MTQEEKELLLKDLCARLPYHPKINIYNDSWEGCQIGEFDNELWYHHIEAFNCDRIEIKPYLRPMSSMTEEERKEIENIFLSATQEIFKDPIEIRASRFYDTPALDWFLKKQFDYRKLIEKGLALEATKGMYESKNN